MRDKYEASHPARPLGPAPSKGQCTPLGTLGARAGLKTKGREAVPHLRLGLRVGKRLTKFRHHHGPFKLVERVGHGDGGVCARTMMAWAKEGTDRRRVGEGAGVGGWVQARDARR